MEKDLHGSAFHQGLNELQEVSGDDGEGVLHEELQVSHNLDEIGHSQSKQKGTYLVTGHFDCKVNSSFFCRMGRCIFLSSFGHFDVVMPLYLALQEDSQSHSGPRSPEMGWGRSTKAKKKILYIPDHSCFFQCAAFQLCLQSAPEDKRRISISVSVSEEETPPEQTSSLPGRDSALGSCE